ncbi:hypothetical protein [Bacillus sp. FJAT-22090]|uniref:hypothetical protein n=1 Tax=Bacillus sp. FJAT-22090 TaxID=1581038 RepID=UPI0011AA72C0|nr:hypothetical protein [Bacillus sp. FJAT-22090]
MFEEWLRLRGVKIPIFGVIVLTNSKVMVVESPVKYPVILHSTIPVFLKNIARQKVHIEVGELQALAEKIKENHQPFFPYPMCERWGIDPNDLLTGVFCGKCGARGMIKRKNGWNCVCCSYFDRSAHINAIREWFVLIGKSINNRQCRYFLKLESPYVASRILRSMNLDREGTSNNTLVYKWKW